MISLIIGDCLEKMRDIPDGSIDMILTDPVTKEGHNQHQHVIVKLG